VTAREGFGAAYIAALERFLTKGNEAELHAAYELGREAVTEGLGVLDIAVLHQGAVAVLVVSATPGEQLHATRAAADFFTEVLSPFEMSFRGYRAANDQLRALNESLRKQQEAAEVANRELEAFSYAVAHDLRSPLRTIDAFSQILIEDFEQVLGEHGMRHLRRVRASAQHMATLIDDLLSLSRVTRAELRRVSVDLTQLAQRITQGLVAAAPEREVDFISGDGLLGSGDPTLVAVVLDNLLRNAWKFTSKRAHARIEVGRVDGDGAPTYFVRDNGAGFDMAQATKLFAPFQRLHSDAEFEGNGIGLATVQRVVERHGGRVWAEAEVDRGATFYFTLGGPPA